MTSEVVVRAFHSNAPISEEEKAEYAIWSDQGWIDCEDFDGAVYSDVEFGGDAVENYLIEHGLDGEAVWVVLQDGRILAVQSIDLC